MRVLYINNDGGVNFFDVVSYIRARETAGL